MMFCIKLVAILLYNYASPSVSSLKTVRYFTFFGVCHILSIVRTNIQAKHAYKTSANRQMLFVIARI